MNSSVSACPVPSDQRPINEYQNLKESCFFRWATLDLRGYLTGMVWLWSLSWLFASPVAAASFSPARQPEEFVLIASAGASLILCLMLLRLYLGWSYICNRLLRRTVLYEETGWYDGQLWIKPPEEQVKDALIGRYQVQPVLQRLRRTFGFLGLFLFGGCVVWNFV